MKGLENLLHDLDTLGGICNSIKYELSITPEYNMYGIVPFNREIEYSELLKFNTLLKIRIKKIVGNVDITMGYIEPRIFNNFPISYDFGIHFISTIYLHFYNNISFEYYFNTNGYLLFCNCKSDYDNISILSTGTTKSNLKSLLIDKKPIVPFLLERIEYLFPEQYGILMGY